VYVLRNPTGYFKFKNAMFSIGSEHLGTELLEAVGLEIEEESDWFLMSQKEFITSFDMFF
jgi:hypothetical protein